MTAQGQPSPGAGADLLEAARFYPTLGWRVFPLHTPVFMNGVVACSCKYRDRCKPNHIGKHPRTPNGFYAATLSADQVERFWSEHPDANIGVRTGAASDLIVIDIDPRNGGDDTFSDLLRRLGPLPVTVECLTGGGGRHLLLKYMGRTPKELGPGVEVKSDGGYVVAPPSLHRSRNRYAWELSAHPEEVAVAQLPEPWKAEMRLQLQIQMRNNQNAKSENAARDPSEPPVPPVSPVTLSAPVLPSGSGSEPVLALPQDVAALIERTLPDRPGQRRSKLGLFARGLKFDLGRAGADTATLRGWVRCWHDLAWPRTSRAKGVDDSWFDFQSWWVDAKIPLETSRASEAFAIAEAGRPWQELADRYDDVRLRHLVAGCREMQRLHGSTPFVLTCRTAAALIGLHGENGHVRANRWLLGLEREGVLKCAFRGKPGRGGRDTANKFLYLGAP